MAFGEEARLLMMRILQNFVRDNRGRWTDEAWQQLTERVRRLGFETITDERMKQLAEDNRERWLAGENGVGPPPAAVPPAVTPPAPAPVPAPTFGEKPPALAEETQSIDVAGVVEAMEADDEPVAVQTSLIDDAAEEAPPAPEPIAPPAPKPVVKKTMKKVAKKAKKKAPKKKAVKKAKKKAKKKAAKKPAKKKKKAAKKKKAKKKAK